MGLLWDITLKPAPNARPDFWIEWQMLDRNLEAVVKALAKTSQIGMRGIRLDIIGRQEGGGRNYYM